MTPCEKVVRPLIPTEIENRESFERLKALVQEASRKAECGHSTLAVVFGNGLSQLHMPPFKQEQLQIYREQASETSNATVTTRLARANCRAWTTFERWRIGTWCCLPEETAGFALLLQWILAGFTRLVFTSNYDLFFESLLLRWPCREALPPVHHNPFLECMPSTSAPRGLRSRRPSEALSPAAPLQLFKYNGTVAFVACETDGWRVWARPGAQCQPYPSVSQDKIVRVSDLRNAMGRECAWGQPGVTDIKPAPFRRACHHVDLMLPGHYFEDERIGSKSALEIYKSKLDGIVILGQWGQDGEVLNDAIQAFARCKPVIQVLWYPPNPHEYEKQRSLWRDLPEGSRHLLVRDYYASTSPPHPGPDNEAAADVDPAEIGKRSRRMQEIRAIGAFAGLKHPTVGGLEEVIERAGIWQHEAPDAYDTHEAEDYQRLLDFLDRS